MSCLEGGGKKDRGAGREGGREGGERGVFV